MHAAGCGNAGHPVTEAALSILFGLLQGWLLMPLALYVGVLVSRDLCRGHAAPQLAHRIAPLAVTVLWLVMSYISAEHVLDLTTSSRMSRQLWWLASLFGLMGYAVTMMLVKRRPPRPGRRSPQHPQAMPPAQ